MSAVNALFPNENSVGRGIGDKVAGLVKLGGSAMPRRFVAFLRGDPDAVPGDYILAIVAVFGMIFAVMARALY